ncbi:MAG: hypothetical protein KC912_08575 [Proteobacteria bacterium]|nr:hypothetical protein [Pseudomonadota bacterium]
MWMLWCGLALAAPGDDAGVGERASVVVEERVLSEDWGRVRRPHRTAVVGTVALYGLLGVGAGFAGPLFGTHTNSTPGALVGTGIVSSWVVSTVATAQTARRLRERDVRVSVAPLAVLGAGGGAAGLMGLGFGSAPVGVTGVVAFALAPAAQLLTNTLAIQRHRRAHSLELSVLPAEGGGHLRLALAW